VHTGTYSVRLGTVSGTEPHGDSWVYQTVTIPASVSRATLSFWYLPATRSSAFLEWQQAQVRNTSGATLAQIFKSTSTSSTWTSRTFDLTPYRGQTVQLWFDVHQAGFSGPTSMYLDDVSVTLS